VTLFFAQVEELEDGETTVSVLTCLCPGNNSDYQKDSAHQRFERLFLEYEILMINPWPFRSNLSRRLLR